MRSFYWRHRLIGSPIMQGARFVGILVMGLCVATGCTRRNPSVCCTSASDCQAQGLPGITPCTGGQVCISNTCSVAPIDAAPSDAPSDAAPSDTPPSDATTCTPNSFIECADPSTLRSCNAAGNGVTDTPCGSAGCNATTQQCNVC